MSREDVTLGDIDKLKVDILKLNAVKEWKIRVKEFAVEHNLTDIEAINIARSIKR